MIDGRSGLKDMLTIEHIMPQSLSAEWRAELEENVDQIHKTWLNCAANLTLTV